MGKIPFGVINAQDAVLRCMEGVFEGMSFVCRIWMMSFVIPKLLANI